MCVEYKNIQRTFEKSKKEAKEAELKEEGKEGGRRSNRRKTSLRSKIEIKKTFCLSCTHIFVSLPKAQMISPLTNSVSKLLASKIHTGLLQM